MDTDDRAESSSSSSHGQVATDTDKLCDLDPREAKDGDGHPGSDPQQQQQQQDNQVVMDSVPEAGTTVEDEWSNQPTYLQLFECRFGPSSLESGDDSSYGIIKSFSTRSSFNTTVGETRHQQLGIWDDSFKMTNGHENNFFKAVKWSPDGTCLLSSSNDHYLRIFALPDATATSPEETALTSGLLIKEGEVIYDMCWYPAMNSQDPGSCCVLSSSRDHPVHLWDAYTGELRCSYTVVDHCEVNRAPTALCFNLDGSKIYCGYNNMVEIFDTTRPGRDSVKRPTVSTRKSRQGQKGVISCLAFNPDRSGLYAAGSYLKTIGLYDARTDALLMVLRDKGKKSQQQSYRHSDMGGVTQVQFSPDGKYLYSASRLDPWIRCWDIRDTAKVLYRMERPGALTNQRISFDISYDGKWLTTGDMNGDISFFDLKMSAMSDGDVATATDASDRLKARIRGHEDVVSAAAFHPSGSILASCSGQRKFDLALNSSTDSSSDSDSDSDTNLRDTGPKAQKTKASDGMDSTLSTIDNSIRLWALPGESVWYVNGQQWDATSMADPNVPMESGGNEDVTSVDAEVKA
ncbi:Telomerase Cajal body protein 1 [Mortierella sp. NVP85]|nr:Telomerase Cajal body protein 1 [Mortierella sp. NVP85]